jgi:hypothetical protein
MSAYNDPAIAPISHFAGCRDHASPRDRLEAIRRQSRAFREEMLDGDVARLYRSFDLVKVPYPTKYGLRDATTVPTPFMHILNRLFVVQFDTDEGVKTLLAEPLDRDGNAETPYFKRLAKLVGGSASRTSQLLWPQRNEVSGCLEQLGLRPEDIDYITYDHLHTQDIRKWLGTSGREAYFPRAKLLVMRREWESVQGLLPLQQEWYPPHGTEGIDPSKIVMLEGDVMLGKSVALIATPGHTAGNHSLVVHTPEGLFVTSENGVCADSYAPRHSRIPGVAKWAKTTGSEVVLNGNTLEGSVDQYISMVQEKEIAGASERDPDFPNVAPSSEMSAHPLSPGLKPTFRVGELRFGTPVRAASDAGDARAS